MCKRKDSGCDRKIREFLMLFDDYEQYLEYLRVWYDGLWTSYHPSQEPTVTDLEPECIYMCLEDDFPVKNRSSRADRRKQTAKHHRKIKEAAAVLTAKVVRAEGTEVSSPSATIYRRGRFIQPECIEFHKSEAIFELEVLHTIFFDLVSLHQHVVRVVDDVCDSGLRFSEHSLSKSAKHSLLGLRATRFAKRASLYSSAEEKRSTPIKVKSNAGEVTSSDVGSTFQFRTPYVSHPHAGHVKSIEHQIGRTIMNSKRGTMVTERWYVPMVMPNPHMVFSRYF